MLKGSAASPVLTGEKLYEKAFKHRFQVLQSPWFPDDTVGAGLVGNFHFVRGSASGHDDDRDVLEFWLRTDPFGKVRARLAGQAKVGHDRRRQRVFLPVRIHASAAEVRLAF